MTTPYWQTISFSPAPCLPCCTTPAGCLCALLIGADLTTVPVTPYASYADAVTGIADHTNNCIAYYEVAGVLGGLTATFDGTTLAVSGTDNSAPPVLGVSISASMSLKAGAVLTIARTITAPAGIFDTTVTLYSCDGTQVDQDQIISPSPTGSQTLTAPADGEYYIVIGATAQLSGSSHLTYAANVTCDMTYWVNPVLALWDDSGTTRKLWACPKLLLPALTEYSGTWYVDCAAAAADIASHAVDCIGVFYPNSAPTSRTATGGSTLVLASTINTGAGFGPSFLAYGSFNAVAGDTITLAYAVSGDDSAGQNITINIIAGDGTTGTVYSNFLSGPGNISGSVTFTVPYTGNFIISYIADGNNEDGATITGSVTVSSSGTLSTNPPQARYNLGLVCAGTLNCGDTCP